jgi:UDP-N-acetyl-D-mannosaminuronic acid dehydrogenase
VKVAHCPERVLPGRILKELVDNDRIVGGIDRPSTRAASEFYRSFVAGEIIATDSRTAELAKLTENAFRDVNIAFANELSIVADGLDVDVWELIKLANHHPRVNILWPGPGVGGHCIAVDPWFIISAAGERAPLMRAARGVNDGKPDYVVQEVRQHAERMKQPKIACLGLAFKADVDDLRESPAVNIVGQLAQERVGDIIAVEPHVRELPSELRQAGVRLLTVPEALAEADIVLGLVDHSPFRELDPLVLEEKIVIDTRGMWR